MLGQILKSARLGHGLSMKELSGKTGISSAVIHNYELNKHAPGFENMVKLARALGLSLDSVASQAFPPDEAGVK